MATNELTHWGIPGMKWGRRRFQNKDGSLTPAGRERYGDDDDGGSAKDHALKSGKASDVLKYKGRLSNKELQDAVQRINLERQLSELSAKETQSNFDKVNNVMQKVGQVTDWANKGINAYGVIAKVWNSFNDKKLPAIDGHGVDKVSSAIDDMIREGDVQKIKDNFGSMTTNQRGEAIKRLAQDKTLESYIPKETDKPKTTDKSGVYATNSSLDGDVRSQMQSAKESKTESGGSSVSVSYKPNDHSSEIQRASEKWHDAVAAKANAAPGSPEYKKAEKAKAALDKLKRKWL